MPQQTLRKYILDQGADYIGYLFETNTTSSPRGDGDCGTRLECINRHAAKKVIDQLLSTNNQLVLGKDDEDTLIKLIIEICEKE